MRACILRIARQGDFELLQLESSWVHPARTRMSCRLCRADCGVMRLGLRQLVSGQFFGDDKQLCMQLGPPRGRRRRDVRIL